MHFSLVKLTRGGHHSAANGFDDVILPVYYALKRLGFTVEIRLNEANPQSRNIIFGSGCSPETMSLAFPRDSIVFNLEQLTVSSPWVRSDYLQHLAMFEVWDYSPRNAAFLQSMLGLSNVICVRLGYVPEMTRLDCSCPQDVDVLFYGGLNDRRMAVLQKLTAAGVNPVILQRVYGAARDTWIARSKIVLNMHYYTPANLEVARLGYLWANKRTVLSEFGPETECTPELAEACRYCAYDDLTETAVNLLADDEARKKMALAGFTAFSAMSLTDELKSIVGTRIFTINALAAQPDHLHVEHNLHCRTWWAEECVERTIM
ncbi:MAG: hypothetical protein LBC79_01230 [Deltaproteobacteria bacterium]|jgi:hypothetical protein|nr:hypothetical protein [Deltaproteobacteria bacterium]